MSQKPNILHSLRDHLVSRVPGADLPHGRRFMTQHCNLFHLCLLLSTSALSLDHPKLCYVPSVGLHHYRGAYRARLHSRAWITLSALPSALSADMILPSSIRSQIRTDIRALRKSFQKVCLRRTSADVLAIVHGVARRNGCQ